MKLQSFSDVISLWGAPAELAADLNEKPDTVRKWKEREFIPSDRWHELVQCAKRRRLGITAELLAQLASRPKPEHAA